MPLLCLGCATLLLRGRRCCFPLDLTPGYARGGAPLLLEVLLLSLGVRCCLPGATG